MINNQQQHARRLLGLATGLLPVADGSQAETEAPREAFLAQFQLGADRLDIHLLGDTRDKTLHRLALRIGADLMDTAKNTATYERHDF